MCMQCDNGPGPIGQDDWHEMALRTCFFGITYLFFLHLHAFNIILFIFVFVVD